MGHQGAIFRRTVNRLAHKKAAHPERWGRVIRAAQTAAALRSLLTSLGRRVRGHVERRKTVASAFLGTYLSKREDSCTWTVGPIQSDDCATTDLLLTNVHRAQECGATALRNEWFTPEEYHAGPGFSRVGENLRKIQINSSGVRSHDGEHNRKYRGPWPLPDQPRTNGLPRGPPRLSSRPIEE